VVAVEPDPVVAATVARLSLEYLTDYITNYRTEKARQQVTFLAGQVSESNSKYQASEYALSNYRDKNRNLFLNTAKIEEQRLQADYLLNQSVYNELSKQFAQAKIKVQEETPVFKVLEPATVPLRKSGPKRTIIVLGFAVLGGILGLVYALFRRWRRVV
ncbi:MAG: lipopolysaccharide biosynthesis protein, partial [Spirosoma sp.]|nr:lipopolysaccharide biosynthesis protein [Spirosoma sp.]